MAVTCFVTVSALGQSEVGIIDHIRVLVRDINASREVYRDVLGFGLPRPEPIVFQEGSAHDGARLADDTIVELIGVVDREKLAKVRPWIVEFLQHQQGAHSVGVLVSSAKDVSDRLHSRGIEAPVFNLVRGEPGDKPILLVTPKLPHLPEGSIFFVQYPPRNVNVQSLQPAVQSNTAEGIQAVWIVVKDLKKASGDVKALGFRPVRSLKSEILGAEGREFATGHGSIVLLRATRTGPVTQFARERGEGVMGLTLTVGNLANARALIEKNTKHSLLTYRGFYGNSISSSW
jgi:hypothetical protein